MRNVLSCHIFLQSRTGLEVQFDVRDFERSLGHSQANPLFFTEASVLLHLFLCSNYNWE